MTNGFDRRDKKARAPRQRGRERDGFVHAARGRRREYATLGGSGTKASRIGIGTNTFGGDADRHLSDEEAQVVVDTAIDHRIAFIDTANAYDAGERERVPGEALDVDPADPDLDWPAEPYEPVPVDGPS
ncbi:aldo/keto reductase [Halorubrum sp. Atlit-28R]|uniref:aldo/keto reductase n=1 Tax=Halorubrum sp. Atlit-28R TaxID=2282129 RepID=UPI000EF21D41|nr:aldo/keto reductase [Halorubrum sp. Atlit-28R]RLM49847.1 aldo/keto reductase [Halorubrum sp. Atlit-28R]